MSTFKVMPVPTSGFPERLREIPDPPKQLYYRGTLPDFGADTTFLCVVGARRNTDYGRDNCEKLIGALRGKNVVIVSGLAIGIDTIAHKAAIQNGLQTLAVPGSGINTEVIYPNSNRPFAEKILEAGGCLLTEFEPDFVSTQWAFPMRNRIMAGLSHAVLIVEAEKKSGTLITARLATDYNRDVLTIPGSVFSRNSEGPHMLLRLGATPITCTNDLLEALHLETDTSESSEDRYSDCSDMEKIILEILQDPMPRDELMRRVNLATSEANILISLLEMKGYIKETLGELRTT